MNNFNNLNITNKELIENEKHKVVSTSAMEVLEEYLRDNQNMGASIEGRLMYL
ncbi:MAG: hypothetical protein M1308_09795 [Actinobacteria bacterium]|nr:hypothetical protein [Actinomycetota bacterium]